MGGVRSADAPKILERGRVDVNISTRNIGSAEAVAADWAEWQPLMSHGVADC